MLEILKNVTERLRGEISEAYFEGANIVLYTKNENFFKDSDGKIREIVSDIKKRIELRADPKILPNVEITEKKIKEIVPSEAEITDVLFDLHRSSVTIEAKKPGLVIGKQGMILDQIKKETLWTPVVQRSPAIKSKITENIRSVLYEKNKERKKFLNEVGEKIYSGWTQEKSDGWARVSILGGGRQVGRSCFLLQTPNSRIMLDCGVDVSSSGKDKFPVFNIPEFDISQLDAIILSHAHLDHSGLLPYIYKMGYKGPVYMTAPTRDIAALLALDFIGVSYKQAAAPIFSSTDVSEMVKRTICLNYGEVHDITPDVRITFYNAGHVLGSAQVHINIGNGSHNFVYSGDTKYGKTRLLDPAVNKFPRVETIQMESTYGGKNDILPPRNITDERFISLVRETVEKGGKVLLPELGLGHAQETLLRVEEAIRIGKLPKIPMYIDGMIWDINAIHTAYPNFLSASIRNMVFQDNNPFTSDIFSRVGSPQERKEVIEGGPCIVIATSGMLVGGASVEYLKHFIDNPNNLMILSSYQGPGSLGRQLQEGARIVTIEDETGTKNFEVKIRVELVSGLSPHSGRNELMNYIKNMEPKPKRIIINHGEVSKSLDLASSIYKTNRIETTVPRGLETIRLR
ncbi:beta-CASP ribonuclease aCPSF1 [Candidatus Pacearchaeota archaeon CG10_big_fil_rev_8_21_14_0_10_32_42]|nr:MAG: beta-CASP ribonuclease aCPSF1 [Candidatus Pacearchaeota archaeon CG10_big_fil_rev_8_21_14_0_10_32_42]